MKMVITTDKAPVPIGPYSQGYQAGDFIFISGQEPQDPQTGKVEAETIEEQTKQTLENIEAILQANDASLKDVVKVTVVLSNPANFQAMNGVYKGFFPGSFPARTCYSAALILPESLIEIDAIAYMGK